ncbi:AAA family ATPase [Streptomyces sp. INA 01156]
MEARLQVRTHEERVKGLAGRADSLDRAARAEREARARVEQRRARLRHEAAVAEAVAGGARQLLAHVEVSLARAEEERTAAEAAKARSEQELARARTEGRDLKAELDKLTDSVHRGEVLGAEKRLRMEQLETKALEELGVEPAGLVAEYGPHRLVPPPPPPGGPPGRPRALAQRASPLRTGGAGEAVEGRRAGLPAARQGEPARAGGVLGTGGTPPVPRRAAGGPEEDPRGSAPGRQGGRRARRAGLQRGLPGHGREFEGVFSRLFPGGEGRLVLTDPDNMLTTGVDVEARPPGKKVKRLSLLSGGERSLTAVALLVSIFKARPSPFYVMDEVEAALDDTNLQRLIGLMRELQEASQLIVITHQKRTMEVADALYGVSMQGDGVSKVISQRLRQPGAPCAHS